MAAPSEPARLHNKDLQYLTGNSMSLKGPIVFAVTHPLPTKNPAKIKNNPRASQENFNFIWDYNS